MIEPKIQSKSSHKSSKSKEEINQIIENYKNNKSIRQISKEMKIATSTISKYLKNANIEIKDHYDGHRYGGGRRHDAINRPTGSTDYPEDFKNRIIQDYLNNKSVRQISLDENININTIYGWLKIKGLKLKKSSGLAYTRGNRLLQTKSEERKNE